VTSLCVVSLGTCLTGVWSQSWLLGGAASCRRDLGRERTDELHRDRTVRLPRFRAADPAPGVAGPTARASLMYAGHFAAALALKARQPRAPTWGLLVGVAVLDLLFGVFVLLGIERVTPTPGASPGFSLDFI